MEKKLAVSIALLIVFSGAGIGLLANTSVYNDVYNKIVTELCLSCVKLKPDTDIEYRIDTVNGKPHPDFVVENLSKGPVFITYRIDFCPGCDELEENLIDVLDIDFGPNDVFSKTLSLNDENFTFIHINTNRVEENTDLYNSRMVYDIVGDKGNPMMVFVTYNYNHGKGGISYATTYGLKEENVNKVEERNEELISYIQDSIELYNKYSDFVE